MDCPAESPDKSSTPPGLRMAATAFSALISRGTRMLREWIGTIAGQLLREIRQEWETAKPPFGWVKAAGMTVFWLVFAAFTYGLALGFVGLIAWLILIVLLIVAKFYVWIFTGVWVDTYRW